MFWPMTTFQEFARIYFAVISSNVSNFKEECLVLLCVNITKKFRKICKS